jgi:protein-L-isoaspartate(D-aspartate) O-methyltransferase
MSAVNRSDNFSRSRSGEWKVDMGKRRTLLGLALGTLVLSLGASAGCSAGEKDYARRRESMVVAQIMARGVHDGRVIAAMRKVPRHRFVPPGLREAAYDDGPLPIGSEQTISQPYIVALMTEALGLEGGGKVLEIGTGSGYQAAILAEIVDTVYTIEILPELAGRARAILDTLGYRNVHIRVGDGFFGWPAHAPFDGIIVTAAAPRVPEPLVEQLAIGGRVVIPVGERYQDLEIYKKTGAGLELLSTVPVRFVPMTGKVRDAE